MRLLFCLLWLSLGALVGLTPAAAEDAGPDAARVATGPTPVELIEDLRILSILNLLQPTRDQSARLALVAADGRKTLAAIDAEAKAKLAGQRDRLLAAREEVVRGGTTPRDTDDLLANVSQSAQLTRTQRTEALIADLAGRVHRILTPEQAAIIESELAPNADQPWRRYGRVLARPAPPAARNAARLPVDPAWWLKELRDLRIDSAEGDPQVEIQDFGTKLTRMLPRSSPFREDAAGQARAFASQVLAMPENVFNQREWELARLMAKQELATRNQQRVLEGKPLESFDAYRWLVEEVVLSPRAETDLRDRAAPSRG